MKTHRCKELLEYNKYAQKHGIAVALRYEKWFKTMNLDSDYPSWILSNLHWDSEWDTTYMTNACRVVYCPYCGEKLENESE